jgi:hypothetical protein
MRKSIVWLALPVLAVLVGFGSIAIHAAPPPCNQVNMHPNGLPNGQVGVAYSALLWLTPANPALPASVTGVSGSFPAGLSFVAGPNSNQVTITGVPTTAGTYTFTIQLGATYVLGTICKVSKTYTITIAP